MTVYFVAHFTVTDRERYHVYEKGFFPILKKYDAKFITFDDSVTVLEGERAEGRTVMIEFASEDVLMDWWNSAEYKELAEHRHASTRTHSISCVKGMPPRG